MKKTLRTLLYAILFLLISGITVYAYPITETLTASGDSNNDGHFQNYLSSNFSGGETAQYAFSNIPSGLALTDVQFNLTFTTGSDVQNDDWEPWGTASGDRLVLQAYSPPSPSQGNFIVEDYYEDGPASGYTFAFNIPGSFTDGILIKVFGEGSTTQEWWQDSAEITGNMVPEPATMLLFGTGLLGLAGLGRRKFIKKG